MTIINDTKANVENLEEVKKVVFEITERLEREKLIWKRN